MFCHEIEPCFFGNSFWSEFDSLQREMNTLFSISRGRRSYRTYPAVNVWGNEDGLKLTAELPDLSAEDLAISVEGDVLTLSGNHETGGLKEGEELHRNERRHGRFSRTFSLPFRVDQGKVNAAYKDGVLTLTLPRRAEDKPKKIEIKAA